MVKWYNRGFWGILQFRLLIIESISDQLKDIDIIIDISTINTWFLLIAEDLQII